MRRSLHTMMPFVYIYIYSLNQKYLLCNKDVFIFFCHGFIILKLVEITGNDNGMVVFSGDVHLRFEWYFRCNDQLMSCPFPVPICERLAFIGNVSMPHVTVSRAM